MGTKEIWFGGLFLSCVTKHRSPQMMPEGRGGSAPRQPHSPLSPCRAREPSSASAWWGARPPVPTCPRRTPARFATPPSTGKGTYGDEIVPRMSPRSPGVASGVPMGGHSVPMGGHGVPLGGCVGTMVAQRCPHGWSQCHHGWPVVSPWVATGGHPAHQGLCPQPCVPTMGAARGSGGYPCLPPRAGKGVAPWGREIWGGHLTSSSPPERCS